MRLIASLSLLVACALAQPSQKSVEEWQARKVGLFIHWGLYSIAGGVWNGQPVRTGYSEQIQGEGRISKEDYVKLAEQFNPWKWDPGAVARLAREAGMTFVVLTSKHHDGFNMFHTKLTPYNVVEGTPYRRDVVKELAEACRREGLKFGVYYSTIDWHYPGATPSDLGRNNNPIPKAHEEFNVGQIRELMSGYGPLTEIWFDMGEPTPEQSKRFADTVHSVQPECMVSGRVFNHRGDFTVMGDNSVPEYVIDEPWQTPASVFHETWGYRSWQKREDLPGKTAEHILSLVKVVSRGGNYLLNIGPRGDGSIVEFEAGVLKGMGAWLRVNGEAIYGAQAQPFRQLDFGHATVKPGKLFLFVRERPADGRLKLPGLNTKLTRAYFLADPARRPLEIQGSAIAMPDTAAKISPVTVIVAEHAGTLDVTPPTISPRSDGVVTLNASQADKFYNYNGRGYYEKPTVYKLQWHFSAAPGRYRISTEPPVADASVEIDGHPAASSFTLAQRGYHTLVITPAKPFVKGARLGTLPGKVSITPGEVIMAITRRQFTGALGASSLAQDSQAKRPNILWITCEDMGPHLHACGDEYSVTPNLDRFAARGSMYLNAWSNAPVCAPARTTIISGLYPTSTGSEHMRSMTSLPEGMKLFPSYLRDAGYYCTNNEKEDYNLRKPAGTWDESSKTAHWRNRGVNQPFFSVFNIVTTHESQIRARPHTLVHDLAKARVPAYHPDTPEVRRDWAQYYDNITTMDAQAGRVLAELQQDGLADDTIVMFYGDHGSGMPRSKRWPYNSGLNVSIVVSIPEPLRHLAPKGYTPGGKTGRLVGFVDLAPTMLSLAGLRPQPWHQGQAFLGPHEAPPRRYVYGFRGRMDERIDCVRTVRDDRYVYVKNYMPHKIYGQHLAYMWETPTTRVWKELYDKGKLNEVQRKFWEPKPAEELFELKSDPDEVNNLVDAPEHRAALERLRTAHREHTLKIRDVGLLPENEIHERAAAGTPYEAGHDAKKFPLDRVLAAAELASSGRTGVEAQLIAMLADSDSAVRYWATMGLLMRKSAAPLKKALADPAPAVRIAAAEGAGLYGSADDVKSAMDVLLPLADPAAHGAYVSTQALNAIDILGARAKPWRAAIAALPNSAPQSPERVRTEYIKRLREHIDKTLD